jgi:hypothetical protein
VHAARSIGEGYAYDQVVIVARKVGEDGIEHCTTWGRDTENCEVAARIGDFLKHTIMGWARGNTTVHEDETRIGRIKKEVAAIADALGERGLLDFADDVRMLTKL